MSDAFSSQPWQTWQPDNLTQSKVPLTTETSVPDASEHTDYTADIDKSPPVDNAAEQQKQLLLLQKQTHEQAHQLGYTEGYQQGFTKGQQEGHEAGYQQGQNEGQLRIAAQETHLCQLVTAFQHALDALDYVIVARLTQLALEAARQVVGHAITTDNPALLSQIQHMIQQEPLFSGQIQLRVHPNDIPIVQQTLDATLNQHGWQLMADDTLHPGGCKVSAKEGELDASLATRWQTLCHLVAPGKLT